MRRLLPRRGRSFRIATAITAITTAIPLLPYAQVAATTRPLFLPATVIDVGSWPEAVAVGDLNGDGRSDAVMTTSYNNDPANDYRVFVFTQQPDGSLVAQSYSIGRTARPESVAIGDMNHDGRNDVVVGMTDLGIDIFPQLAAGTLGGPTFVAVKDAMKIRLSDLDANGSLDVVGLTWGSDTVSVLKNDGTGQLSAPVAYPVLHDGYDDLEVDDVTGDGRPDLVVMSGQGLGPNLSVVPQLADGSFGAATTYRVPSTWTSHGIGVGDVNGDGRDDVVISYGGNGTSAAIAVFPQQANGTLGTPIALASYDIPQPVEVGDMNLDGRADVVVLHGGWQAAGVYLQNPDGTLASERLFDMPYATTYDPHGLALGDVNGDGAPDIVAADYNSGLVVLLNTSNLPPTPTTAPTLASPTRYAAFAALSWSAPANDGGAEVSAYDIYRGTASGQESLLTTVDAVHGFTDTAVTLGTTYFYQVAAVNTAGEGPRSAERSILVAMVPVPPTLTSASASAPGSASLTWTGSPNDGGSPITGYIAYDQRTGKYCQTATDRACVISGIQAGTSTFAVMAFNVLGASPVSNSVDAVITGDTGVPGAPSAVTATRGSGSATVSWSEPASDGGSPITGYTVTAAPGGTTCTTPALGCVITGLTNGTAYSITVSARNANGPGPASPAVSVTPATVPGPPSIASLNPGDSVIGVTWTAPTSDGGSAIVRYTATANPGGASCTAAGLTCSIAGLTNGTPYSVRVTATNDVGTSAASASLSTTPASTPGAPSLTSATAGNASITAVWTAPAGNGGSPITGYTATATPGGASCTTTDLTCTITGLVNGTRYSVAVNARNQVGVGPSSNALFATPLAPSSPPSEPRSLAASNLAAGIGLTWAAPTSSGSSPITGYRIYRSATSGAETLLTSIGNLLAYTDTSVVGGNSYYYQVSAVSAAGEGPRTPELSSVRAAAPDAPRALAATALVSSIRLTWQQPAGNGGAAITGYRIYRSTQSGAETLLTTVGAVSTYTDAAPPRGVPTYYRVSALNAIGEGPQSVEVSAIVR